MFGQIAGIVPIEGQVVLPTGVKKMQFDWNPGGFLVGAYTASASVVDGEGNQLTSSAVTFYAAPLWYMGAFFATLIIIYLVLRFIRSRVSFSVSVRKR
jgi:hypothetical protein